MSNDVSNDVFLSSERSPCSHRFAVLRDTPTVSAIFLLPTPAVVFFFYGKEFLCGQDHPGSENTYRHLCCGANLAVLQGMCRESVLCVDVKCA